VGCGGSRTLTVRVACDRQPNQQPYVAGPGRIVGQLEGATQGLDPVLHGRKVRGAGRHPGDLDLQVRANHGQ
jgi:hypothetical protein